MPAQIRMKFTKQILKQNPQDQISSKHILRIAYDIFSYTNMKWHLLHIKKPDQECSLHQGSSSDLWVHSWIVPSLI